MKYINLTEYIFKLYLTKGIDCPEMHNLISILGVEKINNELKKAQDDYNALPEYKRKSWHDVEK